MAEKVLSGNSTKFIIPSGADIVNVVGLDSNGSAPQVLPVRPRRTSSESNE